MANLTQPMIMIKKFVSLTMLMTLGIAACIPTTATSTSTLSPVPLPTKTTIPMITAPPPGCQELHGRYDFYEIQTKLMTHPLSFRVYLPPCYQSNSDRHYPVLYFLHGQSFNDDQWDRLGADDALDELVQSGQASPFIIVMPKESNYMINQWVSKYGPALAEELVPWIDAHYSTCPDRSCRAIGGLSRGAGWAMRIGLIYWKTFGAIGAHSFAPFRGDYNEVPFWIKAIPPEQLPRIWIDVGSMDFIDDAAKIFKERLNEYHVPVEWHVFPGAHNETYWSAHVSDYLKWYSMGWPFP